MNDNESWRGELHQEHEAWRGEIHLPDWPEESAGPEYWMFKQAGEAVYRKRRSTR